MQKKIPKFNRRKKSIGDGTRVLDAAGHDMGFISSGNFSPTLGHCIALAFVNPSVKVGDAVQLDVRGTLLPGTVVTTPFVAKKKS